MRKYKPQLAAWVKRNEPELWAQSKFTKERWGRLNNNVVESWNNWMCSLRRMSIPWLVSGHIQKLGLKFDKQKTELQMWKSGVVRRFR